MLSPTLLDSPGTRKRGVFLKKTALRGHLRDRRFNIILQQGLGKVADSLAKRLLIAEGFIVKDFQCLSVYCWGALWWRYEPVEEAGVVGGSS